MYSRAHSENPLLIASPGISPGTGRFQVSLQGDGIPKTASEHSRVLFSASSYK